MNALPKVTVAMPAYNAEAYLRVAIDSVLAQTLPDFELLLLDNASTDGTGAIATSYQDKRLRYVRNERNLGLAGNVRRGCALAAGEHVLFLGADDRLLPGFLARACATLDAAPELAMVHGPAAWIDAEGMRFGGTGQAWSPVTQQAEAMLGAFARGFSFSTMVMRTPAIRATGPFDERWQEVIDLWLFLRMCLAGQVGYLDQVLCEYRVHAQAMSMPMYRENLMFRRQLAAARECFAWPEAAALGAGRYRAQAELQVARIAVEVLHMSRADGRGRLLRNLREIVRAVPGVAARPGTWARVGFGLLPLPVMAALQQARRRRSVVRASDTSARPA